MLLLVAGGVRECPAHSTEAEHAVAPLPAAAVLVLVLVLVLAKVRVVVTVPVRSMPVQRQS